MRKKRTGHHYFRDIRHANEERAYYKYPNLVRAKRNPANLPNSWDDYGHCIQKSWKVKREKQYRSRKEFPEHNVNLDNHISTWDLEEYMEQYDIPFRLTPTYKKIVRYQHSRVFKKTHYVPKYCYRYFYNERGIFVMGIDHQIGWGWKGKWVNGPKKRCSYSVISGYKLTYWCNTEINFDFFYRRR